MKLTFHLDGHFSPEQHEELCVIFNEVELNWNKPFLPQTDDYFNLDNFTDKVPKFCLEGTWKVHDREFVNETTVLLGLLFQG